MNNFNNVLLLSISAIISWVINYTYHPLMIKFLDVQTFAEFESLISIFNILWVLVWGISFFLLKEISKNSHDLVKIKSIFIYSNKFLFLSSLFIYLIFLLLSPFISSFLKINDILPLNIVWFTIILSFLWIVIWPILQWLWKFKIQAFFSILWSIIKLLVWVWFVFLWYQLYWAIIWFIISWIIILILSYFYIYKLFYHIKTDDKIITTIKKDFKKDYKDIFYSFLLIFVLSLYMNLDIILAKNLFSNEMAWMYAWVSVIAKFLIFLWWTIETVYYPQIIKSEKIVFHFVRNAVWMMLIMWIWSVWFFYLFWNFFLELLKKWFWEYNSLLILWLVYCIIYIIMSFLTKILVWFKKYSINYVLLSWIFIIYFMTKYIWNSDINDFMYIFIWVWSILIIIMGLMIWKLIKNK